MKFHWQPFAALTLLPMGIALADYADTAAPRPDAVAADVSPEQRTLIEGAEHSLDQVSDGVTELAIAVQSARRDGDAMLATCLADALDGARKLQAKAIGNVNSMQQAPTLDAARALAAEVAKTDEQLARVLEIASKCEGGNDTKDAQSASSDGNTVTHVTVDGDPATLPGSGDGVGGIVQVEPPNVVPPSIDPPPTSDSMDPATDVPMDMPMTPPTASPMR